MPNPTNNKLNPTEEYKNKPASSSWSLRKDKRSICSSPRAVFGSSQFQEKTY